MELSKKSESFILDSPLAEPNEAWNSHDKYHIERIVTADGTITWYGINTNWKKELGQNWTELATNDNAKPLEKYLPEIIYGEDRIYWKECDTPLYEKMYIEYYREKSIKELAFRDDKGNLVISQKDYIRIMSQQNTTVKIVYEDKLPTIDTMQYPLTEKEVFKAGNSLKEEIIKLIFEKHPHYGVGKGWSEYVGGMADTGRWFFDKMITCEEDELRLFYEDILSQENKPQIQLTEKEIEDSRLFRQDGIGTFTSKREDDLLHEMNKDFEKVILYGSPLVIDTP